MNVLGPFQFLPGNTEEDNCGCGGDYCQLVNNGDTLAFQISAADACCTDLGGCSELTESCITAQGLQIGLDGTNQDGQVCWDKGVGEWSVDDVLISNNSDLAGLPNGAEFLICFCISGNTTAQNFGVFIDSDQSVDTVSGNGTFCLRVTRTVGTSPSQWGVQVRGGDDSVILCMSCLTICQTTVTDDSGEIPKWQAYLVDENQEEILEITGTNLDSGNIAFEQDITVSEVGAGCRQIKLVNNCSSEILYSQCLQIQTAHSCTLLFKWRDTKNVFGFDYLTDDTYYNYLRVRGRIKHPTYRTDKGLHLLSNNNNVLTNATVQKILTVALSTPGVPDYVHEQIALALVHQEFYIDGTQYVADDGDYSPAWRRSSELAASQFEVIVQDFDGVNTYCS